MKRAFFVACGVLCLAGAWTSNLVACGDSASTVAGDGADAALEAAAPLDATLDLAADGAVAEDDDGAALATDPDADAALDASAAAARDASQGETDDASADADAGPYRLCPSEKLPDDAGWVVTQGFDVSEYEYVDWDAAVASGPSYKYAFARATAGSDHVDTQFSRDWKEIKRVGLIRGAYHYFHAEEGAAEQATEFLDELTAVGGLQASDLPPVLDMEDNAGMPDETVTCRMKGWLAAVETKTGRVPMIFSLQKYNSVFDESFGRYSLWTSNFVANPLATCPRMLTEWSDWAIWQWSATASVPGIYVNATSAGSGSIETSGGKPVLSLADLDYFNGTESALTAFLTSTVSASPPATPAPPSSPPTVLADAGTSCDDGCCVIAK